ncbi:hypothetical protein [Carnobacterium divergens]|uniref:hypothetical protein n=1 Tax=Carnobacterium divergens TaxID=2748 RepID=UPI0039B122EC
MLDFFKENLFNIVLLVLIYPCYKGITNAIENGISDIPNRMHEKNMVELNHINDLNLQEKNSFSSRELQVDNYYRSISGATIEKLFSSWTDIVADTEKVGELPTSTLNKMIKELMMYGSAKTVRIGAIFQQYNYSKYRTGEDIKPYVLLYIGAALVASLKKDFTGYDIDPEDLIKMKIKDLYSGKNKQIWEEQKKEAMELIKDGI